MVWDIAALPSQSRMAEGSIELALLSYVRLNACLCACRSSSVRIGVGDCDGSRGEC